MGNSNLKPHQSQALIFYLDTHLVRSLSVPGPTQSLTSAQTGTVVPFDTPARATKRYMRQLAKACRTGPTLGPVPPSQTLVGGRKKRT